MLYVPKPGDIGLSSSKSLKGRLVKAGQAIIDDHTFVTHAFIVLYDGYIVEAESGGANFNLLTKYPDAVFSKFNLTEDQREDICVEAIKMYGTPYSFLDYLSLALTHFNIYPHWVRKRVQDSGHMICSQLCAEAYRRAGVDLFPDKRLSMDVTPGDIARLIVEKSPLTSRY